MRRASVSVRKLIVYSLAEDIGDGHGSVRELVNQRRLEFALHKVGDDKQVECSAVSEITNFAYVCMADILKLVR